MYNDTNSTIPQQKKFLSINNETCFKLDKRRIFLHSNVLEFMATHNVLQISKNEKATKFQQEIKLKYSFFL